MDFQDIDWHGVYLIQDRKKCWPLANMLIGPSVA